MLLVFDGHNLLIRHYVVNPTLDVNGERVGGVVGSLRNIANLISELKATQVVVVWDGEGGSQRRRTIYENYKSGRRVRLNGEDFGGNAAQDMDNMRRQRRILSEMLTSLGIPQVRCDGVEADDLIAYTVKSLHTGRSVVVTTDKDMLQLIGPSTVVYSPIKKRVYDAETFKSEFGVLPENYGIMKALVGDGSDNIEGIPGFGIKTVAKAFPFLAERKAELFEVIDHARQSKLKACKNLGEGGDYVGRLRQNMKLMDLSEPMISANAARDARAALSATTMACKEIEFMVKLQKEGIALTSTRFLQPYKELNARRWPKCQTCGKKQGSRCPTKCDENH